MAELDNHYETILTTGKKGEVVRDAIIAAAKLLKKAANNSYYLEGIPYSDFANATDYWRMVEEIDREYGFAKATDFEDDSNVIEGGPMSTYYVTAGEIYNLLDNYLRPSLKAVLKHDVDPASNKKMKDAIYYYLSELEEARKSMISAIKAKNGTISKDQDETLLELANIIRTLDTVDNVETETYSVNKNHITIDANTEHHRTETDPHYAYSEVTVNITPKTLTKNVTENGILYKASDEYISSTDPYEGYSSVTVNIPGGKSAHASPGSTGRTTGKDGVIVDDDDMMSSKEINDKGVHSASEDGVLGWKTVKVNVELEEIPEGATFTVTFNDGDGKIIDTVSVLPFQRAQCTKDFPRTKTVDGISYVFSGWSPNPNRVVSDMEVVAGWKPGTVVAGQEIPDDWDTIVSNSGAPYNIGDWKRLTVGGNQTLIMQKVYEGEDGTTSTWLSKNVFPNNRGIGIGWIYSDIRSYLNSDFLDLLKQGEGESLYNYIVPVMKRSICGLPDNYYGEIEIETLDRIWIPSTDEVFGECPDSKIISMLRSTYDGIDPNTGEREWARPMPYGFSQWNSIYTGKTRQGVYYTHSEVFGTSTWTIYYPQTDSITNPGPSDTNMIPVFNDSSKGIKNDITNTNPSVYMLRSLNQLRRVKGMTRIGVQTYGSIISTTGQYSGGDYYHGYAVPIGFCL